MFSSMEKIRKRRTSHSIRLEGTSIVIALTTALVSPLVDTLGIEFHEEDVRPARVGLPIQGAIRVACHTGNASCVHLRKLVLQRMHKETERKTEGESTQTGNPSEVKF
jgi:hypothetical protein